MLQLQRFAMFGLMTSGVFLFGGYFGFWVHAGLEKPEIVYIHQCRKYKVAFEEFVKEDYKALRAR